MVAAWLIRSAAEADAPAITAVHDRAWQAAYHDLLPSEVIAEAAERRGPMWRTLLAEPQQSQVVLVAEEPGQILGLAAARPSREDDASAPTAELGALYVDPGWWRRGIGRRLLSDTLERLRAAGFSAVTLRVLADNQPARRFYEAAGWREEAGSEVEGPGGGPVVRYRIDL